MGEYRLNAWMLLAVGIVFEVTGTTLMKLSNGFAHPGYMLGCLACFGVALAFIAMAMRSLEIGVVYAIWSGLGVVLITLIGRVFFQEVLDWLSVFFIALIVIGVVGLFLFTEARSHG